MKFIELLRKGEDALIEAGIENAYGEALLLLKYVYGIGSNDWLLLSNNECEENKQYMELINRRQKGEPLQYIMGFAYFYGRKFFVQKGVLIPRFDTEILALEAIKEAKKKEKAKVLDMCAGSGCIGLSIALEVKESFVTLSDIEKICLEMIEKNAEALCAENIEIVYSNLFLCIKGLFDIITVNPPYISKKEYALLEKEIADYEPKQALYGGEDGLMYYRNIAEKAGEYLREGGLLLLEIGYDQAKAVTELFMDKGYTNIETIKDIAGKDRVISVRNSFN